MLTLLQTVPIQVPQSGDSLGTAANWSTIIGTIITTLFILGAILWIGVPRAHGCWLRNRNRWPATVQITNFLGYWNTGSYVVAYYKVKPRWRTFSPRHFPRVTEAKLIGEFAGQSHPTDPRKEPFFRMITKRTYPPNDAVPVDREVPLEIRGKIRRDHADMNLLRAYVLVTVKYPPHKDNHFKTELLALTEADVESS